jgi:chromosome partitioning protein
MIISFINAKGGVAKTTSSVYLATALSKYGKTKLLDADPQGSSTDWITSVEDEGEKVPFGIEVVNQKSIKRQVNAAEYIIIDTPPGNVEVIEQAIAASDIVVVPTDASALDMQRVWPSIHSIIKAAKPGAILLTKVRKNTKNLTAALNLLNQQDTAVLSTHIPLREEIKSAYATIPQNLHGYEKIAKELIEVHNEITAS